MFSGLRSTVHDLAVQGGESDGDVRQDRQRLGDRRTSARVRQALAERPADPRPRRSL